MPKGGLPLKWPGGKVYLASKIVDLMPPHIHYVEAFFGGGAVLFNRNPDDERFWLKPHKGVSEVVNDINGDLATFWMVLQSESMFSSFQRQVQAIPVSRREWSFHHAHPGAGPVSGAVSFFVNCRQSRAGMMKDFTSITRSRTRRQMNGNVSEWLGAVDGLPDVHARLRMVLIENMDAIDLIRREDTPGTLFYLDPPYLHETRASKDLYAHEMSVEDHRRLLDVLVGVRGKVILSGYPSQLYDDALSSWRKIDIDIANHLAGGKEKARECERLWLNY